MFCPPPQGTQRITGKSGLLLFGGLLVLLLFRALFDRRFEVADAFAQSLAERRKLGRAEKKQGDADDQQDVKRLK